MTNSLANLAVFTPVDQHYLLQARQMQALSFSVHILLVCFGIALPVMVLFAELLFLRSGDRLYRNRPRHAGAARPTVARRFDPGQHERGLRSSDIEHVRG